jgi:hypothetical protein
MTPTRTTTGRSQIGQMRVFATRGVYVRVWPRLMRASNPFHHSELVGPRREPLGRKCGRDRVGRLLSVVAAAALALLAPAPAAGAMCFEFTLDPPSPRVGEAVTIGAKTLWAVDGIDRFSVRLWAPDRSTTLVELTPVPGEQRWRGVVVFDRAGTWAVQAALAERSNEYPCFYTTVDVGGTARVQSRTPDVLSIAAVGLLVAGISALTLLLVRGLRVSTSRLV